MPRYDARNLPSKRLCGSVGAKTLPATAFALEEASNRTLGATTAPDHTEGAHRECCGEAFSTVDASTVLGEDILRRQLATSLPYERP